MPFFETSVLVPVFNRPNVHHAASMGLFVRCRMPGRIGGARVSGETIYDALHAESALKAGAESIFT